METIVPKITAFLIELLYFSIDWLYNAMIDVINALILIVTTFITGLLALFPSNPCGSLIASCTDVSTAIGSPPSEMWTVCVNTIAWLIPVAFLANLIGCAMITVMVYFSIAPLMRWAKLLS
jgi:hypothetical protein